MTGRDAGISTWRGIWIEERGRGLWARGCHNVFVDGLFVVAVKVVCEAHDGE